LWEIPFSDSQWADRVPEIVESDDIGDLYEFFDRYIDHLKAQSRQKR